MTMLRVNRQQKTLTHLDQPSLTDAGLRERYDLQAMILKSPDAFFKEMGEELLIIGQEIKPAEIVDDRIDILALDKQARTVILELKRSNSKLHLLQAISYAAMIADWQSAQLIQQLQEFRSLSREDAEALIEDFLEEGEVENLNQEQRIILVSDAYDYTVLATARWLSEDVRCYRLTLSADGNDEFFTCACVYPPHELAEHAVKRGRLMQSKPSRYGTWEQALEDVKPHVAEFFRAELERGQENYLRKRKIFYRVNGKRRFSIRANKREKVFVRQSGRFPDDEEYWRDKLGADLQMNTVNKGRSLTFYLTSSAQLEKFRVLLSDEVPKMQFLQQQEDDEQDDDAEGNSGEET